MKPERVLLVAALGLLVVALSAPLWWRFGPVDLLFIHSIAIGTSLIVGGYICSRWRAGRATARLMLLAACLWFVPYVGFGNNPLLFSIGLVTEGVWIAVVAHFIVAFPEGVLRSRGERVVVACAYLLTFITRLGDLFYDPAAFGCTNCPPNAFLISSQPQIPIALSQVGPLIQLAIAVAIVALVVRRWLRATRPERRVLSPVFAVLITAVLSAVVGSIVAVAVAAGLLPVVALGTTVAIADLFLLLLPISFGIGIARGVVARSGVGNLMIRIGQGRTAPEIERDVAWALADPTARIALRTDGGGDFRLINGQPVKIDDQPAGTVTLIEGSRGAAAALLHDPTLTQLQPELLDAVASATRLALENQRLESEVALAGELPVGLTDRLQREGSRIGETKTLTISVLMSDIRGYSTIAETADPRELAEQLNDHRVAMNRVISDEGGTVLQYAGDSVFAVFGAPEPTPDHARRAVAAAQGMQVAQAKLNEAWSAAGRSTFGLGIGVTTGEVAAALTGSSEHVEYSVVGDVVNLAQRLQAWAAPGQTVISSETHDQIGAGVVVVQLPTATVKGRRAPVTAFRVGAAS